MKIKLKDLTPEQVEQICDENKHILPNGFLCCKGCPLDLEYPVSMHNGGLTIYHKCDPRYRKNFGNEEIEL